MIKLICIVISFMINIYVVDSQTWTLTTRNISSFMWNCIATSTSGDYAIAGIYGGALYTSNDSVKSWYLYDNSHTNLASWFSVAISSNGN